MAENSSNNNNNLNANEEVFNIWKEWEESSIKSSSTVNDQKFYVTTAINYTNGEPHIGHAYEAIVADIFARYNRVYGRNTYFLTGTDEHGQKIAQAAAVKGITPIELCDGYAAKFQALNRRLYISNDRFIRTTSPQHHELARLILQTSLDNGDIYLGSYTGWYNVREEAFVTENEAKLSNFKDPSSGNDLVKMEEESYFFRLSKFREPLIQHITENPTFIQPAVQRDFILKRLEGELLDLSISRTNFKWGVELPNNPDHVMYVWFDALTNYLTGIDWPSGALCDFWPAALQVVGKDITWFHCVIWPAMLLSAKIPLPATVFGHGFIHDELGRKMSKSLGNVVDPNVVLDQFPSDSFRISLIANNPFGGDVPFNIANLVAVHNSDLADTIGNLVNRCAAICAKNSKGVLPSEEGEIIFSLEELRTNTEKEYAACALHSAYELAIQSVKSINLFLTTKAPWKIKDPEDPDFSIRNSILRSALEAIYISAHFLAPFVPETASRIFKSVSTSPVAISSLNERNLTPGTPILKFEFKKLELKAKGVTETKEDRKAKAELQKQQKQQKKLQSRAQNQNQNNENKKNNKKNNNNNEKKEQNNNAGNETK